MSGGKQQIFTADDGKSYTIKNSSVNNVHGTGEEKIIVENGSSSDGALLELIWDYLPRFITLPIEIIGYDFIIGCFMTIHIRYNSIFIICIILKKQL